MSVIFVTYAKALKPGAPFVFTFHHNDIRAYVPVIVAILDAGMVCTATLAAPAEMEASLHIARTSSSIVDSVFVCRSVPLTEAPLSNRIRLRQELLADAGALREGGVRMNTGDIRCLALGHLARYVIAELSATWDATRSVRERGERACQTMEAIASRCHLDSIILEVLEELNSNA